MLPLLFALTAGLLTACGTRRNALPLETTLFPADPGAATAWVMTQGYSRWATWQDATIDGAVYQVVNSTSTGQELFRVYVADANDRGGGWWRYGIVAEGDFNGDGKPDFSWYGAHDHGGIHLLFLSAGRAYRCVHLHHTLYAAWRRLYPETLPLTSLDWGNDGDTLEHIRVVRDAAGLSLVFEGHRRPEHETGPAFRVRVSERDFVYTSKPGV